MIRPAAPLHRPDSVANETFVAVLTDWLPNAQWETFLCT
jgi:hypothetical protein